MELYIIIFILGISLTINAFMMGIFYLQIKTKKKFNEFFEIEFSEKDYEI